MKQKELPKIVFAVTLITTLAVGLPLMSCRPAGQPEEYPQLPPQTPQGALPTTPEPTPEPILEVPPETEPSSPTHVTPENLESMYTNPITYHVSRTLTIRNETASVDRLKVWMPEVTDWDSQRDVFTEEIIPSLSHMWKDDQYDSGILYWEFLDEPIAGAALTITEDFTYTCFEINYFIEPDKIPAYDKNDPEYVLFTRSGHYLEANDPEIVETASEIAKDQTNPYMVAYSI